MGGDAASIPSAANTVLFQAFSARSRRQRLTRVTQAAMGLILLRFALSIWFGGGLAVLLGTRSIFRAAETRRQGGLFSGAVLASFSRLRWAAVVLTAIAWLSARPSPAFWAAAAAFLTIVHAPLDARIRGLRAELGGSTEGLAADDPRASAGARSTASASCC